MATSVGALSHPFGSLAAVTQCKVDGCETGGKLRLGMCERHYRAFKLYGDPTIRFTTRGVPAADRFWMKVERTETCWVWVGATSTNSGYGHIQVGRTTTLAHRFAYELMVGPIPDGLVIDHLCRNRVCMRPDHLEPVTQAENIRRGQGLAAINAAKTHCKRGHPFDEANTHHGVGRSCRTCERERMRRVRAKEKRARMSDLSRTSNGEAQPVQVMNRAADPVPTEDV